MQKEARAQAAICMANLPDVAELTQLPPLPPRSRNQEDGRSFSLFSLALHRVKVTKGLKRSAEGTEERCVSRMHSSGGKRQCARMNVLKNVLESMYSLYVDYDVSVDGTEILIAVFRVHRLMSTDQHGKLDDL